MELLVSIKDSSDRLIEAIGNADRMVEKRFFIGNVSSLTGLSSAEVYDPKTNTWTLIESMSTRRSSVGVGVVHGELYAVGGYDGSCRECLSS